MDREASTADAVSALGCHPGDGCAALMPNDDAFPELAREGGGDSELAAVNAQLIVFARELGELYTMERARSAELEQALQDLEETYLSTMRSLAIVIEAKDRSTRGHLDRTHEYGLALARRIAPELAASPALGYGFFLHDIGKVGVPETILRKTEPLTPEEWAIMRSHPAVGADIVGPIRFLRDSIDTIRYHHEWYDGSGYPEGLRSDSIPLAARIFAVADSYDAMTSDRPYRRALPVSSALGEIRAGAGTQFDPHVVDAFVDLMLEDPPPPHERDLIRAG